MAGCLYRCPTISGATFEEKWDSLRDHYGPRTWATTAVRSEKYSNDLAEFIEWANNLGKNASDANLFGRWLNWKLSIGSQNYGNLSTRVRDGHTGIRCIPCPYDTMPDTVTDSAAWDERSNLWLGFVPGTRVDHSGGYMRVAQHGSVWGFECTSDSCPHFTSTGKRYFHG